MTDEHARFAVDQRAYERLLAFIGGALETESRFPELPVRRAKSFANVVEFDRLLGSEFGSVLASLVRRYQDLSVAVVVLDPTPEYYVGAYGVFPAFEVQGPSLELGYHEGLRHEPGMDPTGAIAYTANVLGIAGSSGEWSVWGQRDWEIALLFAAHDDGEWLSTPVPILGRDTDLDAIRSPAGWGMNLSDADRATFSLNLQTRGSG